jgi:galactitol-specific phosphotransferase system IIB component
MRRSGLNVCGTDVWAVCGTSVWSSVAVITEHVRRKCRRPHCGTSVAVCGASVAGVMRHDVAGMASGTSINERAAPVVAGVAAPVIAGIGAPVMPGQYAAPVVQAYAA